MRLSFRPFGAAALVAALLFHALPAMAADLTLPAVAPLQPAAVAAPVEDFTRDVFFFGGRFHEGYFTQSFVPTSPFENNYIVGGGYQQFFSRWGFARFGFEVGAADRFTADANTSYPGNSGEVWGGGVVRLDGWDLGPVHITPSLTVGFSVVSGLIGVEAQRAAQAASDRLSNGGRFLVYLGPEVAFSLPTVNPDLEVFWRAQHRSGAFGALAELDGANADVVGVRWKF